MSDPVWNGDSDKGWVRVELVDQLGPHAYYVRADTFGEAASKVPCQPGEIQRFDKVSSPLIDPDPQLPVSP